MQTQSAQANGKTLQQLIELHPEFNDCYFCNENENTELTGDVVLELDENYKQPIPVLYFAEHESYLNLIVTGVDENNWHEFMRTQTAANMLQKAFDFFTN